MASPKIIKLELDKTEVKQVYGGSKVLVTYSLKTEQNGIENNYIVEAEIRGIATADLYLQFDGYEALSNNEETLTAEGVEELLNW